MPMVHIEPTTAADLPDLLRLWNDGTVMSWVGCPDGLGYDLVDAAAWFDRLEGDRHRHHRVIRADRAFCGEAFYAVDAEHRRAGLDIKVLPEAQGRGIASQALGLLIDEVFTVESGVDAVWTEPSAENEAARRLYARHGIREEDRPADMVPGRPYWELSRRRWRQLRNPGTA